jgi:hypothetical protein
MLFKETFDFIFKKHKQSINTFRALAEKLVLMYSTGCILREITSHNEHIFVTSVGSLIVKKNIVHSAPADARARISVRKDK